MTLQWFLDAITYGRLGHCFSEPTKCFSFTTKKRLLHSVPHNVI